MWKQCDENVKAKAAMLDLDGKCIIADVIPYRALL